MCNTMWLMVACYCNMLTGTRSQRLNPIGYDCAVSVVCCNVSVTVLLSWSSHISNCKKLVIYGNNAIIMIIYEVRLFSWWCQGCVVYLLTGVRLPWLYLSVHVGRTACSICLLLQGLSDWTPLLMISGLKVSAYWWKVSMAILWLTIPGLYKVPAYGWCGVTTSVAPRMQMSGLLLLQGCRCQGRIVSAHWYKVSVVAPHCPW